MRRIAALLALVAVAVAMLVFALMFRGWPVGPVAALDPPADTVVLVTLDGVRPRELLVGTDPALSDMAPVAFHMPFLIDQLAPRGTFLGSATGKASFSLGNPMGISMPSYQSIFSGRLTACVRNECGAPWGATLITDIEGAAGSRVGFFSFSEALCASAKVTPQPGSVLCGAPGGNDATDAAVFDAAKTFLHGQQPRFLYVALGDTDSVGHSGDYAHYLEVLATYDAYLKQLSAEIDRQRAEGRRITLLVTTDHGRGEGAEWTEHRWNVAGSGRLWLLAEGYGVPPQGVVAGSGKASLYNIRATVNHLLSLTPPQGPFFGPVLREILDPPPGQSQG